MSEVETEAVELSQYDVLDRSQAEEAGWVVVHESVSQGQFRAEKMVPNGKVEQVGSSEASLLLAISYYEGFQASLETPPTPEQAHAQEVGDASRAAADGEEVEGETAVLTVTAPDGSLMTEEEWSQRDSGYPPAEEAMVERQEINTAAENEAKQPDEGEIVEGETLITESADRQPEDTLLVREGEESLADVFDRKQEESELSESERGAANAGIGPNVPDVNPMGGEPETYDPGPGLSETEQAMADEHTAAAETQQAARDEDEAAAAKASTEAPAEAEAATGGAVATPAAEAKAEELGVDLSQVEGTGADGKIVVGDVEAAAASSE